MSIKSPKNLSISTTEELTSFIDQFDVIFTDCDGVLYLNGSVIDNSNLVINKFLKDGKNIFLLTNSAQQTREEMLTRYQSLGFNLTIDNILTSSFLTAKYLSSINFTKKAFVIGCDKIGQELDQFGIQHVGIGPDPMVGDLTEYCTKYYQQDPDVGAVIVSMDSHFSLPKLLKAMNYLLKPDVIFLATNADDRSEFPGFVFPDAGPFLAAIERGSYRKATIIGKPSPILCDFVELPVDKNRILMIGDRLNIDIAFGSRAGFKTLLVETGDHNMENIAEVTEKDFIPDYVIESLGKFL